MNAASHRHSDFFTVARALVLAGCTALAGISCTSYPPPGPDGNVFIEGNGRPRYGYGGSQSPNNPAGQASADPARRQDRPDEKKVQVIKRDPNDTTVDMTPPEQKAERTPEPTTTAPAGDGSSTPPAEKTTPPSDRPKTTTPSTTESKPSGREDLPVGTPVVGRPGIVYSPYYTTGVVDVSGMPSGQKVRCPYTQKIFRVP